ncbi:MAG: tetratricopeptide repeat protein, partial [Nitrososphaera sp.]
IRLTIDLVEANTLRQKSFIMTKPRNNLLTLQDSVGLKLAEMLEVNLQPNALGIITAGGTSVPGAYEFYVQGRGYLQRPEKTENIDNAIELFMRAIKYDSLYALACDGLAHAFLRKYEDNHEIKWFDDAVRYSERALKLDSMHANIRVTLGQIHNVRGQYTKAIDEFRKALALNPNSADAYIRFGEAYALIARHNDAENAFLKAIALKPDYWMGYNFLGDFYLQQGRYEEAVKQFIWVIKLTPDNIWGYNNAGAAYLYLEKFPEAKKMFERSIEIKPNEDACSNLGSLYYSEKEYVMAARTYEKALELNGTSHRIWGNLAEAYSRIPSERHKVHDTFQQAVLLALNQSKINPDDPSVLANLAVYYVHLGEKTKARTYIDRATERELDPYLMYLTAYTYEQLNNRELALNWIGKALKSGYPLAAIERDPELEQLRKDARFPR